MKRKVLPGLLFAVISTQAYSIEIDAEVAPGYDNNPFKLADRFNPDGAWYLDSKIKASQKFNNFRLRGTLKHRSYEGASDDGDYTNIGLDGRYKKKHMLAGKTASSQFSIRYSNRDKTYVQRSTGQIGTFAGQQIKDRYDNSAWGAKAKTTLSLNKQVKTGLALDYQNKNYDDLNIAGLSNLDYDQFELSNHWGYQQSQRSDFGLVFGYAHRKFDDRREKTLLGASVAGTNLTYDYYFTALTHKYEFSSQLQSKVKLSYKVREDSGAGYYDTDDLKISAGLDYDINNDLTLATNLTYQDLQYDNGTTLDEIDAVLPGKSGYSLKVRLEKTLTTIQKAPLVLASGFKYDNFNSDDPLYEYDRFQAFVGLNLVFSN